MVTLPAHGYESTTRLCVVAEAVTCELSEYIPVPGYSKHPYLVSRSCTGSMKPSLWPPKGCVDDV
eukprot:6200612-Pleurochrysis_carterae.AAC.4